MTTTTVPTTDRQAILATAREVLDRAVAAWPDCLANLHVTERRHTEALRIAICCNDLVGAQDEIDTVRHYLGETCAECGAETGDEGKGERSHCSRECWLRDDGGV